MKEPLNAENTNLEPEISIVQKYETSGSQKKIMEDSPKKLLIPLQWFSKGSIPEVIPGEVAEAIRGKLPKRVHGEISIHLYSIDIEHFLRAWA